MGNGVGVADGQWGGCGRWVMGWVWLMGNGWVWLMVNGVGVANGQWGGCG